MPPQENFEILGALRCILRPSEALLCMQADSFFLVVKNTHMDIQHKQSLSVEPSWATKVAASDCNSVVV